jgi:hypothetical protein
MNRTVPDQSRLECALCLAAAALLWCATRLRARRAYRRWGTPEARQAYLAGKNLGSIHGIAYCTALALLLIAGLWLAGCGL